MINLSQILEGDNGEITFFEDTSQVDLEDILQEDDEVREQLNHINSDSQTLECNIQNSESFICDQEEFISPIQIMSLGHQSKTFAISTNYLINYWERQLALFSNNKNNKTIQIQDVSYISVKGQIIAVGFESGQIHIYEGSQLKLAHKIQEHQTTIIGLNIVDVQANELILASSDLDGNVKLIRVGQNLFRSKIVTNTILNKFEYPVTQLISQQFKYSDSDKTSLLLTLGNSNMVITLSINPEVRVVHVFDKQKSNNDLHWGKCNYEGNQIQLLSIQWNSFIQLITFLENSPWYFSFYSAETPLVGAKFISENLIIAATEGQFQVLYIPYFSKGKYCFKSDSKAKISNTHFHQNIYCLRAISNVIYFISENKLYSLHALSWLQYLKSLIQNDSPQWSIALRFLVQVYRGKVKGMPNLELDEDRSAIQTLAPTLITSITNSKMNRELISAVVQFILLCQIPQHLMIVRQGCEKQQILDDYYRVLEIHLKKITQLPKEIFFDLANKFSPESFQKLVINLDLNSIDIGYTYDVCLSKEIYTPLLYICPRKEEDFLTPLNKMYEKHKQELYEKCLWFIEITQKQILFPNDQIPLEIWKKAVRQQMLWLMEVLDVFQSEKLFQILTTYLKQPCLGALHHESVYSYFNITQENLLATKIFEQVSSIKQQYLLQYLLFISKIIDQIKVKDSEKLLLQIFEINKSYIDNYVAMPEDLDQILQIIYYLMPHTSLIEQAYESQCVDYIAYYFLSQNQFNEAVKIFFNYEEFKLRVYKWLEYQPYDPLMLDHLDKLLELDPEKCAKVFQSWPIETLQKLIIYQPKRELLHVFKYLSIDLSQFLQLKLIELISIHEPENTISWLKNRQYQLEDVEQIFQQTNNIEGLGYIMEQKGLYQQAIDNYLQIYKEDSRNYILSFRNQDRVTQLFQNLMRVTKIAVQSDDNNQEFYLYIAHQIFNPLMHQTHWCKLKRSYVFNQQFSQLFMHLFRYSPTELIKIIEINHETFNQVHLKSSFITVFKEFGYEKQLVEKISKIIRNDNIKLLKLLYSLMNKSNLYEIICIECQQPYTQDQAILLKCGHTMHPFCLENKYCPICQNISAQSMLESIGVEELKKSILKSNVDNQQLQLLKNVDDMEFEDNLFQSSTQDDKEMMELRLLNKMDIYDQLSDSALQQYNSFLDQYF
ncbi:unnamed protein product (macronuclear) [Paramecium tetraurelia]|uniref:RING-type domain-containing protein n=1 Tax=Paramecium tetraurelia TaxID=5888 RepID=A0C193_PARTE|nr:uncharacterized protein GSPATT00034036001 [Paramecium tetraurelia]CAK64560.1 unnamed protein product [Paramecium tetraurelia]|eukprot:XP_001431958.1 hypothetical protein (macronuclear) [Paramecium tetraurelia strain d4-2]